MRSSTTRRTAHRTARRDDRGATAVEYALLIAGVAIAIVTSVALIGGQVGSGVAAAAEGLSGAPGVESTQSAAESVSTPSETATPTQTATPTPTATAKSCSGTPLDTDGRKSDYVSPTCDATSGTWTCPRGYNLRSVGANWTCKD